MISLLFAIVQVSAQAQTVPGTDINALVNQARSDLAKVSTEIEAESKKTRDIDPCHGLELQVDRNYIEWFIKHSSDYQSLMDSVNSLDSDVASKVQMIKAATVEVNPDASQGSSQKITFQVLASYFQDLNTKLAACEPEKRDLLLKLREDATFNQPHISHSQIKAAAERLTANINASLHESGHAYQLNFVESKDGFDLVLSAQVVEANSGTQKQVSLFKNSTGASSTFADLWKQMAEKKVLIDNLPIDASDRYWKMKNDAAQAGCPAKLRALFAKASGAPYESPFTISENAFAAAKAAGFKMPGLKPLYESSEGRGNRIIPNPPAQDSTPLFYSYEKPVPGARMHALYTCRVGYISDYFVSPDSGCEGQGGAMILGYVFDSRGPETVELRRSYSAKRQVHRLDTGTSLPRTFDFESVLGYAPASDLSLPESLF